MTERFQPLLRLIRTLSMPWTLLITAGVIALVETGAALWIPMLTRDLVNGAADGTLPKDTLTVLVAVLVGQATLSAFSLYLLAKAGEHMTAFLRQALSRRLLRLPMGFHDNTESGELVSRTLSDTASVESLLTEQAVAFVSGIVSMLGAIAILWFLDWRLTLVLFSSVVIGLLMVLPVTARLQVIGRQFQDRQATFSGRLTSILGAMRLLKASCAEQQETERAGRSIEDLRQLGLKQARVLAVLGPAVTLAITGAMVVILGYGGARVGRGELEVGTLVAFILYLFQVVLPMVQLSTFFAALNTAAGAAEHLSGLLEEPLEDPVMDGPELPQVGAVRFEQVDFAYDEGRPVLQDFNLDIPVGQITALVGPSGSGKTTVLSLLERFYAPQSGGVFFAGQDLQLFPLETWRRRLGYVPQEAPVVSGTVLDNLCWGLPHRPTDDSIRQALQAARADEFVERLEHGLDTEVGERGVKLSGGQRQRLAIARAFLADPQILMLDEATANLDAESEDAVRDALQRLMQGRTTVVIAHRLSTVVDAHQIAVVEDGRVTGLGRHGELLANHELYRGLVERQMVEGGVARVA